MKTLKSVSAALLIISIFTQSCSFEKIGKNLGNGLGSTTDTLGQNLIAGIRDELAKPETRLKISGLLDSLVSSLADTLNPKLAGIRDNLLNHKTIIWVDSIVEALTGNQLKVNMDSIQATMVGKTKTDVFQMRNAFRELLEEILSDSTKGKIGAMRDELLGAKTDSAINKIVDHAMATIAARYKTDLNPQVKGDVSFITKNAETLLLSLGGIAVVIVLLVWRSRRKYLQMVTLLSKQINQIPDQKVYDYVTSKIKDEAISTGLEPDLRSLLNKNGMLGDDSWKSYVQKAKNSVAP